MTSVVHDRRADERGMSTAEYAVGTAGAACIACVLFKVGQDATWLHDLFEQLQDTIMRIVFKVRIPWRTLM